MAGGWGRLLAALGPPRQGDPPPLRALRRPRPHPRHQTELLLLLLETPRELCAGREGAAPREGRGSPEVGEVGGALLSLLSLPPAPPPAPPRSLLLLATLSCLLATGDWGGVAVLGALLLEGGAAGGAPAAAAECLRELRRVRTAAGGQDPPGPALGPPRGWGSLRSQPLALLLAEQGDPVDPTQPHPEPAPPRAFLLTPAARAQLLLLGPQHSGGGRGSGVGSPPLPLPPYATGDPAPLQATLLQRGGGTDGAETPDFGGVPPPRLASLAQHPALPPPLRLFFLLCLLQGGGTRPPPTLPPRLAAALFPGGLDPPELFSPRFEAAAALGGGGEGARGWLRGALGGGGPPAVLCRAALSYRRWCGGGGGGGEGELGETLGGAAEKLLGGAHPAAPPHLLELAKALGGSLGAALRGKVLGVPPPPPGTPQLRGVLKGLLLPATPPRNGDDPPGGLLRGYLRRVMAAEGGRSWGGSQGALSAAAPLLPCRGGAPFLPSPPPPGPACGGAGVSACPGGGPTQDPDVGDRSRLHAALAAALGPPKLAAVLGTPPRGGPAAAPCAPRAPQDEAGGGGGNGGGGPGGPPTLLLAPAPPCRLRCLPAPPPPPLPAPPGTPQTPQGWGRALAARGGPPVAVRLQLRVEPLGAGDEGGAGGGEGAQDGDPNPHSAQEQQQPPPGRDPPPSFGDPSPPPPLLLALQLQGGGAENSSDPRDPPAAEGRLAALGAGGAELSLTLRPQRPLPPALRLRALYSPGGRRGAPPNGEGGGGAAFLAPLPPLPLPLGLQLRPLRLPPGWDPPRRRKAFEALWGALRGGPQSLLVLGGEGDWCPPSSLTPFLLHRDGDGGGWGAAAALPPRGVVLVRSGGRGGGVGGGWVELRAHRWGGVLALARLLRGEEGA